MAKLLKKKNGGFTLIELMIVVVIIGVLAATAIPAFLRFVKRSKTAETGVQLKAMFDGAAAYYAVETSARGYLVTFSALTNCVVADATTPTAPTAARNRYNAVNASFDALDWGPADALYYQYRISSSLNTCNVTAASTSFRAAQTFVASGNLDGDAITSNFEMSVGVSNQNGFGHSPVFYVRGTELE